MTKWAVLLLVGVGMMGRAVCFDVHLPPVVGRQSAMMATIVELRTILETTNFDSVSTDLLKTVITDVAACLNKFPIASPERKDAVEAVKTYIAAGVYSLAIRIATDCGGDKDVRRMVAAFDPVVVALGQAFCNAPDFMPEVQKFAEDAGKIFSYHAMINEFRAADKEVHAVQKKNNELSGQIALLVKDLVDRVPDAVQRKNLQQMVGYRMYGSLLCLLAQYKEFRHRVGVH